MRRLFRRCMPDPRKLRENPLFARFGDTLLAPALWRLSRRSVAGGLAAGMFCGLIPGPFQMIGATIICLIWRVNLPLALFATLYTNPLTIVPLYLLAFGIGRALSGSELSFSLPPERGETALLPWFGMLKDWLVQLGEPILIGLPVLAASLAIAAWCLVQLAWRLHVRWRAWRRHKL